MSNSNKNQESKNSSKEGSWPLKEFFIEANQDGFFKDRFCWEIIPKLAVIAGANGSGKTLLLNEIDVSFKGKNNFINKECIYIKVNHRANIPFEKREADPYRHNGLKDEIGLLKRAAPNKDIELLAERYVDYKKFNEIAEYIEEKHGKKRQDINDDDFLDDFLKQFWPIDDNERIEKSFANFSKIKAQLEQDFKNTESVHDLESIIAKFGSRLRKGGSEMASKDFALACVNSAFEEVDVEAEKKKFVDNGLKDYFGSSNAPWEIINDLFKKNKFKYEVSSEYQNQDGNSASSKRIQLKKGIQPKFITSNQEKKELSFDQLSTGEQLIVQMTLWCYGESKKIANSGRIMLMDEFDAHLNPSLAGMFVDLVKNVMVEEFDMQVIMTTHSPSTVAFCDNKDLFWMENGKIEPMNQDLILEKLTPGILVFRKQLLDLLINDSGIIILTEGVTDTDNIKIVADKFPEFSDISKCRFIPAQSAGSLKMWLKMFNKVDLGGKKIIAIFDFDKEGIDAYNDLIPNNEGGKILKPENNNIFTDEDLKKDYVYKFDNDLVIMLLPVGESEYKDQARYGYHSMEFLFKKEFLDQYLIQNNTRDSLNNTCFINPYSYKKNYNPQLAVEVLFKKLPDKKKIELSNYVDQNKDSIVFENFKPLLNAIQSKIQ